MLDVAEISSRKYTIIECDNCSSHYKSAPHFCNLQDLSFIWKILQIEKPGADLYWEEQLSLSIVVYFQGLISALSKIPSIFYDTK